MNNYRLATNHLLMIGMILFGILAILARLFKVNPVFIIILFIAVLVVVALLYYQKRSYDALLSQSLSQASQASLARLLEQMPVGVVKLTADGTGVEWYNPYAELLFAQDNGIFDEQSFLALLSSKKEARANQTFELGDRKFAMTLDVEGQIFYCYDCLSATTESHALSAFSPVIGTMSVDNYDDVTASLTDAETSQINSFVANFIANFAQSHHIFYRRVDMDRFYFFTDYTVLTELMANKFDFLEQFREEACEKELPLTLSMGFAFGDHNHHELGQLAQKNLNLALVRGGDQVVVKENAEHADFMYFGGGSAATVKRSRTRTRAMMTAISDKIKLADAVFVVGHRNLDLDALGAAVGMQHFASSLIEQAYVVYDPEQMSPDIDRAIKRLQEDDKTQLLSLTEASDRVTAKSLLVMVDHSKLALTLSETFYNLFKEVIIVDHHRRDDDFPTNAMLSFIESGASSACELVTELIQFQAAKPRLTRVQASVLMAGIMLDTNRFSSRVTSRTFDVASYLRGLGSDSVEIQYISATDFEEYRQINSLILRGQVIFDNIIVAVGDCHDTYTHVIASKAADTLLKMAGIEASFVITRNIKSETAISARSRDHINVQRLMEKLGGGGHFHLAACQLPDLSLEEAYAKLLAELEQELDTE